MGYQGCLELILLHTVREKIAVASGTLQAATLQAATLAADGLDAPLSLSSTVIAGLESLWSPVVATN
jgi:hypothetical protein